MRVLVVDAAGRHDDELRAGMGVDDGLPAGRHGDERHHGQGQRGDVLERVAAPSEGGGGRVVGGGPIGRRTEADVPDGRRAFAGAEVEGHARVDQRALLGTEAPFLLAPLDVDAARDDVQEARLAGPRHRVALAQLDREGRPGDGRAGLRVEQPLGDGDRDRSVAQRAAAHRDRARPGLRRRGLGGVAVAAAGREQEGRREQQAPASERAEASRSLPRSAATRRRAVQRSHRDARAGGRDRPGD